MMSVTSNAVRRTGQGIARRHKHVLAQGRRRTWRQKHIIALGTGTVGCFLTSTSNQLDRDRATTAAMCEGDSNGESYKWLLGSAAALAFGATVMLVLPESSTSLKDLAKRSGEDLRAGKDRKRIEKMLRKTLKSYESKIETNSIANEGFEDALCVLAASIVLSQDEGTNKFEALDHFERAVQSFVNRKEGSGSDAEKSSNDDTMTNDVVRLAVLELARRYTESGCAVADLGSLYVKGAEEKVSRGDRAGALEAYGRALALFGGDDKKTDRSKLLGAVHRLLHTGSVDSKVFEAAIAAVSVGLGSSDATVALVATDAAKAYHAEGNNERALASLHRALEIHENSLSPSNSQKAQTLMELAKFLMYVEKRPHDALKAIREAVVLLSVEFGSGHPHVDAARRIEQEASNLCYK